jgi:hypothetical protein
MMATFLVKKGGPQGLAAHLADDLGRPLCKAPLRLATWEPESQPPERTVVCGNCLKKQTRSQT